MDKEIASAVKRFVTALKKEYEVEKVIVFGSRARGDCFKTSDIDLIVVSHDFEGINFMERMSRMYNYWDANVDLEVLCYTPKEFEIMKKIIGIVQNAVKEGVEV